MVGWLLMAVQDSHLSIMMATMDPMPKTVAFSFSIDLHSIFPHEQYCFKVMPKSLVMWDK